MDGNPYVPTARGPKWSGKRPEKSPGMIAFIAGHSPATRRRNLDSSPGSRAAPSSGMPSCPVEAHMASRGAASTSRMGRPAPRRRSSAQRGFLRAARSRRRDDDESDSASASPAVKVEDAVTSPSSVSGHAADAGDDAADAGKASDRTARVNPPPRSTSKKLRWSKADDELLRRTVERMGARNWREIAKVFGGRRTDVQCLHRWTKVLRPGLVKGAWTAEEDAVLRSMVHERGLASVKWSEIAARLPGRLGKQCRERWFNHLDPSINKGPWTYAEDHLLVEAQQLLGNKWSEIAKLLPGRTENAVKNRWNSSARRRFMKEHGGAGRAPLRPKPTALTRLSTTQQEHLRRLSRNVVTHQQQQQQQYEQAWQQPAPGEAAVHPMGQAPLAPGAPAGWAASDAAKSAAVSVGQPPFSAAAAAASTALPGQGHAAAPAPLPSPAPLGMPLFDPSSGALDLPEVSVRRGDDVLFVDAAAEEDPGLTAPGQGGEEGEYTRTLYALQRLRAALERAGERAAAAHGAADGTASSTPPCVHLRHSSGMAVTLPVDSVRAWLQQIDAQAHRLQHTLLHRAHQRATADAASHAGGSARSAPATAAALADGRGGTAGAPSPPRRRRQRRSAGGFPQSSPERDARAVVAAAAAATRVPDAGPATLPDLTLGGDALGLGGEEGERRGVLDSLDDDLGFRHDPFALSPLRSLSSGGGESFGLGGEGGEEVAQWSTPHGAVAAVQASPPTPSLGSAASFATSTTPTGATAASGSAAAAEAAASSLSPRLRRHRSLDFPMRASSDVMGGAVRLSPEQELGWPQGGAGEAAAASPPTAQQQRGQGPGQERQSAPWSGSMLYAGATGDTTSLTPSMQRMMRDGEGGGDYGVYVVPWASGEGPSSPGVHAAAAQGWEGPVPTHVEAAAAAAGLRFSDPAAGGGEEEGESVPDLAAGQVGSLVLQDDSDTPDPAAEGATPTMLLDQSPRGKPSRRKR